MSEKGRITIKKYFQSENIPTEENFNDLVDSSLNKTDDQIFVKPFSENEKQARYIGVGSTDPQSPIGIRNRSGNEKLLGFENSGGEEVWHIAVNPKGTNNGLKIAENENAASGLFLQSGGKIGIGTTEPDARLEIHTGHEDGFRISVPGNTQQLFRFGNSMQTKVGGAIVEGSGQLQLYRADGQMTVNLNGTGDNAFDTGGNFGIGTLTPKTKLDVRGAISGFGIVPIGSITAWHKSLEGTPALPDGWVECNGQKLNDDTSPYHNQTIPDLNNAGRFLRGATTSGTMQADALQGHKHSEPGHSHNVGVNAYGIGPGQYGNYVSHYYDNSHGTYITNPVQVQLGDPVDSGTGAGTPRIDNETRPINMSVVWIMRVK